MSWNIRVPWYCGVSHLHEASAFKMDQYHRLHVSGYFNMTCDATQEMFVPYCIFHCVCGNVSLITIGENRIYCLLRRNNRDWFRMPTDDFLSVKNILRMHPSINGVPMNTSIARFSTIQGRRERVGRQCVQTKIRCLWQQQPRNPSFVIVAT